MTTKSEESVIRERVFHDQWAETINLDELLVVEAFESPTAIENRYALEQLGNLAGKKVLDLGCGAGETTTYLAMRGAEVVGCDISGGLLGKALLIAKRHKVSPSFFQTDAGHLPFADESFDFVFGNGVLHHVNLLQTAAEIKRVLKKGGKAVFIEPLPYNPIIEIYRHMAKGVRTEDEKPLSFKQINQMKTYFSSLHHEEFWLFSLLIFLHFFFIKRWHPSKVRYWKKVIEEGESYREMFTKLNNFDRWIMKFLPFLKPLCWNTVITAQK